MAKGSITIRLSEGVEKWARQTAADQKITLTKLVDKAIWNYLTETQEVGQLQYEFKDGIEDVVSKTLEKIVGQKLECMMQHQLSMHLRSIESLNSDIRHGVIQNLRAHVISTVDAATEKSSQLTSRQLASTAKWCQSARNFDHLSALNFDQVSGGYCGA